tara:strand:+ start:69 stop:260 length:192 start_codon:yes stop_codon:yes gene_type:complete
MMQTMPNYGGETPLPEDQIAFGPQTDGPLNAGKMTDGVSNFVHDLIHSYRQPSSRSNTTAEFS